jgi:hypothetical protein
MLTAALVGILPLLAGLAGSAGPAGPAIPPSAVPPGPPPTGATLQAAALLREEAYIAYLHKDFSGCADLYFRSASGWNDRPAAAEAWYGAGACASEAGDRERAFQYLASAAAAGFHGVRQAGADIDLKALRADPRWAPWLDRIRAQQAVHLAGVNREIFDLFEEDQADRPNDPNVKVDWAAVVEHDRAHRQRVRELIDARTLRVADDYYDAAMIFQHGDSAADFALAHQLCLKASELDPTNRAARWLAAASQDRYLMTVGKPQLYGTQFKRDAGGPWYLYPVDPSTTDEERARWNVPPLSMMKKRAEALNTPQVR